MSKSVKSQTIGFSRTSTILDAIAFGAVISFPLILFGFNPVIVDYVQEEIGAIYLTALVIYLPVLLSYAEYTASAPYGTSPYELVKAKAGKLRTFFTGWTQLYGLIGVSALLLLVASDTITDVFRLVLEIDVSLYAVMGTTLGLALINELIGALEKRFPQTTAVWFCIVFSLVIIFWAAHGAPDADDFVLQPPEELRHWLAAISALGIGLWGIPQITELQYQYRRRDKTTTVALLLSWTLAMFTAFFALRLVVNNPQLLRDNIVSALTWTDHRFQIMAMGLIIAFSLIGMSKAFSSAVRLSRMMSEDGFLPLLKQRKFGSAYIPFVRLLIIGGTAGALAALLTPIQLLVLTSGTALFFSGLTLYGHLKLKSKDLNPNRWVKLPLHPTIPLLAVFICGFLFFLSTSMKPAANLTLPILGALFYLAYGRKGSAGVNKQEKTITRKQTDTKETEFRIGVFVSSLGMGISFIKLAEQLASARGGEVLVIRVLPIDERLTAQMLRNEAEKELTKLQGMIPEGDNIETVVRIAADINQGIVETIQEYEIDYIFLPNPSPMYESMTGDDIDDDEIFKRVSKPILIGYGTPPEQVSNISVSAGTGSNAPFALQVGNAVNLSMPQQTELKLFRVTTKENDKEYDSNALKTTLDKCPEEPKASAQLVKARVLTDGILEAANDSDLLIMGASVDPVFKQSISTGTPHEVAKRRHKSTIIVKASESIKVFWARRFWAAVSGFFPNVQPRQRNEIYASMRHHARASTDFYIMMSLASSIAILGLLLNSGAVIIGAMLVAPLMSPILASAQGLVHGNPIMIRRAFRAIIWGILVALTVSTLITIALGTRVPGSEILGRTQPNFLDLLVAISAGAAAAYATSRPGAAGALPGVAIAVALVPPLCVVGYGLGISDFGIAGGAFLLFLTNLAAIIVVGSAIFLALGFRPAESVKNDQIIKTATILIACMLLLAIPLGFATQEISQKERIEVKVNRIVREALKGKYIINDLFVVKEKDTFVIEGVLFTPLKISQQDIEDFRQGMQEEIKAPVKVKLSILNSQQIIASPPSSEEKREQEIEEIIEEQEKEEANAEETLS